MFNTDNNFNVFWDKTDGIKMTTIEKIELGAELFVSYGADISTFTFLAAYGFTVESKDPLENTLSFYENEVVRACQD